MEPQLFFSTVQIYTAADSAKMKFSKCFAFLVTITPITINGQNWIAKMYGSGQRYEQLHAATVYRPDRNVQLVNKKLSRH
jgi:hypothetical protein